MYQALDDIIQQELIPALLDVNKIDKSILPLFSLTVVHSGIRVLSPTMSQPLNHQTSDASTTHLKEAILQVQPFNTEDHDKYMSAGRTGGQKAKGEKCGVSNKARAKMWAMAQHIIKCTPSDLLTYCDGCNKKFTLQHALECKLDRLIIVRHNEVTNELARVGSQAYLKAAIHNKPFIYGQDSSAKKEADDVNNSPVRFHKTSKDEKSKLRKDVSIQRLWTNQTDSIIDIQVTDSDAKS
eukprot:5537581-Ditylum_brightwellii.AAC.1